MPATASPSTGAAASTTTSSSAASATATATATTTSVRGSSVIDRLTPPKSATKWQIAKFRKVLSRRRANLERLDDRELGTLHDLVVETVYGDGTVAASGSSANASAEAAASSASAAAKSSCSLARVVQPLPHPNLQQRVAASASNSLQLKTRLRENVLHGLISAFHASVDSRLKTDERKRGLDCVKSVLDGIEVARTESVKRLLEEEKDRRDRDKEASSAAVASAGSADRAATSTAAATSSTTGTAAGSTAAPAAENTAAPAAAGTSATSSTSAATTVTHQKEGGMGQLLSTTASAQQDDDSDDEVIVLDGPPTPPSGGRKSRPLPTPKDETRGGGVNGGDAVMTNGDANAAASASAAASSSPVGHPSRPRHKQTAGRPAQYKTITAQADTQRQKYSASLHPRPRVMVTIDTSEDPDRGTRLDEVALDDVRARLAKWDPYWDVVHDFAVTTDDDGLEWGARTGPVGKYKEIGKRVGDLARAERYELKTAAVVTTLRIAAQDSDVRAKLMSGPSSMKWGKSAPEKNSKTYVTGDRRCIVRMLPLYKTDAERKKYRKKRADTHLWPVGTFLQLNSNPIQIAQRKQQSHDHDLWKGISHALDLTRVIADIRTPNLIEIVARDDTPYAIQVAVCDYVGPDALYDRLVSRGGQEAIPRYEYDEALNVALNYVKNQMVVLDSDNEDDGKDHDGTNQTYSLLCPISMSAMQTPVRGVSCRHIACFDLRNWLHNNIIVGGTRWRCALCEDFLSPSDLVVDGMFCRFLNHHKGEIRSDRDKIQLRPDGTWSLMEANKLRYQSKKRSSGDIGGSETATKKSKVEPGAPTPPPDNGSHEVIELD